MVQKGTLYFFCGKMGVGKSTYAEGLVKNIDAVLISEDEWLSVLYKDEIHNMQDYIKYASRLKNVLKAHILSLLESGLSVVMDFPGNTMKQRTWFRELIEVGSYPHKLIYLKASDELCLAQIEKRRISSPDRSSFDTKEVFYRVTSYFQEPTISEGFMIESIQK